jgi:HAD superfamily hydrolase (TIGR01509 family)
MTYQAAIFDMDGLLLDTERVCMQAFREACEFLSLPMHEDVYLSIIGSNSAGIKRIILNGYGADLDYEALNAEWMRRYYLVVRYRAVPLKKGVVELLSWLKSQSIPIAVATSSTHQLAATKLKYAGLLDYFEHLSTGCEVSNGKPDPEIFLLSAQRLNILPQHCLVFEDSNNGARAGVAAGMQVYQIPDLVKPCAEVTALGHTVSDSLTDVLNHLQRYGQHQQA